MFFNKYISKKKFIIYLSIFIISLIVNAIFFNYIINQTVKDIEKKNNELLNKHDQRINNEKPKVINEKKPEYYIVTTNTLNIRKSNSINSECIGLLHMNDIIEVFDKNEEWYKIENNLFVNKNYLQVVNDPLREFIKRQKINSRSLLIRNPIDNINSKSNLHIEDLKNLLSGTKLEGIEEAILKSEQEYDINAFFILAVARLESGNGTSEIAINKNNLFGLNTVDKDPYNKAFTFNSKSESVYSFSNVIKKYYIDIGLKTVSQINTKYSSSDKWANKINNLMISDYQKIKN